MGGGKDQDDANRQLKQQAEYQQGQQKQFDIRNQGDLTASRGRADEMYGSLYKGYSSIADPNQWGAGGGCSSNAQGGGGGGGGGAAGGDPRFASVQGSYQNFMDSGGWEPGVRGAQQGRIDAQTKIGMTGGLDDAEKARARGGGGYEEFAKTGGYSDADRANIRSRGNAGIASSYANMRADSDRFANVQGGYGPGRSVMAGRLGREQAMGAANTARDTEIGIQEKVNAGRQWGTAGQSASELSLQDLLSKNKLQGLAGANSDQAQMMQSIMGGRQWGTQGMNQMAESDRAAAASAAASGAAGDRWQQEFNLRKQTTGLEGLGSLYTSAPAEYMQNKDWALQSAGQYGGQAGNLSTSLKTGNKTGWDTAAQIGSIAAGVGAGVMTGGASTAIGMAASGLKSAGGGGGGGGQSYQYPVYNYQSPNTGTRAGMNWMEG